MPDKLLTVPSGIQNVLFGGLQSRTTITPRPYQEEAIEESFRLWDQGKVGVLHRMFTGAGKSICATLCFERWMDRDPNNHCMVISYETQLVWQFAQEIKDVLGVQPGIEMAKEQVDPDNLPRIVVASRQSLLRATPATQEQRNNIDDRGLVRTEAVTKRVAGTIIKNLDDGWDIDWAQECVDEFNDDYRTNRASGACSRLHKFNHEHNWLICFDEAHKHVHILKSVGHVVDWFGQNEESRRFGMTATPKRSDNISIGSKMFPAVAIDYPLISPNGRSGVRDGYAVRYDQRFIHVEKIDFTTMSKVNGDFDPAELDLHLNNEKEIAKLLEPTLDMIGDRQTLIFSPTVDMAKNVAHYVNARVRCQCPCGECRWLAPLLVEVTSCKACGTALADSMIDRKGEQAHALWGEVPHKDRKAVYDGHQAGRFQILSVCNLCRESYNDPSVAAVAIFRPVSKSASSLAEQMKGRGSRPLRGLIDGLDSAEERLEAIRTSDKPTCMIIDLVGISGLADCSTTATIYGDGIDDAIVERADEILVNDGGGDVEEALERAQEEVDAEREERRLERQRQTQMAEQWAQRRAQAGVQVDYSIHERGHDNRRVRLENEASEKQVRYIFTMGLDLSDVPITKNQASRIITQLQGGMDAEEVKYLNSLPPCCGPSMATPKQKKYLQWKRIPYGPKLTFTEASTMIDKDKQTPPAQPHKTSLVQPILDLIDRVTTNRDLTGCWDAAKEQGLDQHDKDIIIAHGKKRREEIKELDF